MRKLQAKSPVARLLREMRVQTGFKQAELAQRLGVSQSFVSKYEIGEKKLEFVEVQAICAALGISLTAFIEKIEAEQGGDDASTF